MPQPELPGAQHRGGQWSGTDAESDTAPLPRVTASGAVASSEVNNVSPPSAHAAATNGAAKPDLASEQRRAARQEQERASKDAERAAQEQARHEAEQAAQEQARMEAERTAQEQAARQEAERAAQEQAARQEAERAAQEQAAREQAERAAQEQAAREEAERAAQEQAARQEAERAAQEQARKEAERAAQERARQLQESLARQERKHAAKQEREAKRERAAEQKRVAKQERERAAQEVIEQKRAAEERARQEQERAAEELARQLEEIAAQERIRQEQDREDREWAAQKRARLEREREEAEELARRQQAAAEHNGAAQPVPHQFTPAGPAAGQRPAQPQPRVPQPRMPQPRVPDVPGSRRYRTSALVAAMVVLVGAGSLAVARTLHHSAHAAAHAATRAAGSAAVIRNEAAGWVAQQISRSSIVSCDPAMCLALKAHGVPTYDLLVLEPTAPAPLGSQFVAATATLRDQFGQRLSSVYAPAVVASFGSGNARIDIRQIAPNGAAAFLAQLKTDQQERKTFETELLASPEIKASASARSQLRAGEVDTRLATVIEGMASELTPPVRILAFGDRGPDASPDIPLRSATMTGSTAALQAMLVWVLNNAPFAPTHAEITQQNGQPVLIVEFAAPSPLGVFSPSNPSNP
jgi:hypothetical protein